MIKFLFKKCLCDYLDNFLPLTLLNLGFILCVITALIVGFLVQLIIPALDYPMLFLCYVISSLLLTTVYTGAAAGIIRDLTEYKKPGWKDFITYLKSSFKNSLLLTLLHALLLLLVLNAFSFYNVTQLVFSRLTIALMVWVILIWLAASQFFFVIHYRMEKKFFKIIKTMFLIFFDNQLFSIVLLVVCAVLSILTIPTLCMIPGYMALPLFICLNLKYRLYKYDYLDTLPSAGKIPWQTLLAEEIKSIENRRIFRHK